MTIRGYSDADISRLAGIDRSTVHTTRCVARKLLGVRTDMQLLALAVREAIEEVERNIAAGTENPLAPLSFIEECLP